MTADERTHIRLPGYSDASSAAQKIMPAMLILCSTCAATRSNFWLRRQALSLVMRFEFKARISKTVDVAWPRDMLRVAARFSMAEYEIEGISR